MLRLTEDWAVQRALTVCALNMYFLLVFLCRPAVVRGEFWLWQIQRKGFWLWKKPLDTENGPCV